MRFFVIATWKEHQHYKDRNPPWIKLHVSILSSATWVSLDDASRVLAVACMVLASKYGGKVPSDPSYVQRVAYLHSLPNFKPLIDIGFLLDPDGLLAEASELLADARPEESRGRAETEQKLPQAEPAGGVVPLALDLGPAPMKTNAAKERFEKFWAVVRKKVGKKMAMAEFLKANPDDALLEKMIRSMTAYNKSNDDVTKLKDPERWIKGERWNDELLMNGVGGKAPVSNAWKGAEN